MQYFVTGATGFIGRRLVKTLLSRRGSVVYFLLRPESEGKVPALLEYWGVGKTRAIPVFGDLTNIEANGEKSGTFTLRTADTPDTVTAFYESKLKEAGFEVQKASMSFNGAPRSTTDSWCLRLSLRRRAWLEFHIFRRPSCRAVTSPATPTPPSLGRQADLGRSRL